jgi:epidermal growth factor receptor substrate 15
MAPRVWNIMFLRVLCIISLLVSPTCFAFSQKVLVQILELSSETIKIGLIALTVVIVLLLMFVIIIKVQLSNSRNKQTQYGKALTVKQSLLNDFKVGMLHINQVGEIIFANQVAAFLLGSKEDKLTGRTLIEVFDVEVQGSINSALVSNKYELLNTYVAASKRHLQLGLNKQSDIEHGIASVISLTDVSNYQHKIEQQFAHLNSLNKGLQQTGFARLSINFDDNTFSSDQLFSNLLLATVPFGGELDQLKKMLNTKAVFEWEQALEISKKQHQIDICLEFLLFNKSDIESQFSEPKHVQLTNTIPLRLIGLSRKKNDKGETTHLDFLVQNLTELEQQRSLQHVTQQKVKMLVANSPNPVYLLDEQGKFVDCNSAFEILFNQKLSKIKHKSIQELSILPAELNRLHKYNSSNFSSVNIGHDKEFEWQLADGVIHTLKVKLKFFSDKNKKCVGMLGVIQDDIELKQCKTLLEQERINFSTILESAPLAVAIINGEDQIIRANTAMTDRLGLSDRELKKDTFYHLFNDSSHAAKAAKKINQTGRLRAFAAHLKGKNAKLYPSELHVDCLNKENQEYLCWISDDTKEQFHQDKFEGLLQHSAMPMAILGEHGFTKLNPAACAFFNIKDEHELFGNTPFALELNPDQQASEELERYLTKVKLDGQAKSLKWEHRVGQVSLPCQATYVPMYKGQEFDSILCIWNDLRDLQLADEARIQAINLHQSLKQEVVENQQLLQNSQVKLATKEKKLVDTETRLQSVKDDLSEKKTEFSDLQQAHQSVTDNLLELQDNYTQSRSQLGDAQNVNSELTSQLNKSTAKVKSFQDQCDQISDALQHSDKNYKAAQEELSKSEHNAKNLKQEQHNQKAKMHDFAVEIDGLKQSIEQKDLQINEVGGQINSLQSELTNSGNTSENLRQLLVNQSNASEQAEEQRRSLEQTYKIAESELSNKVRHVEDLQNEMQKFEEMSNQQKGDMQQQQNQLMQQLESKQQQLQETQQVLDETQQAVEQEKVAKEQQQNQLEILQQELSEMEHHSQQQQQKMTITESDWQAQQQKIQQELAVKQQQLHDTECTLQQAKEQSESEQADKEQQLALFEKLQSELAEVEQRNTQQQQQIALKDGEYQQQQENMQQELKAKQHQLQETEQNLSEAKEQTETEKKRQQTLFEKLQNELAEMEQQSSQQQQKIAHSDQDWQKQQQSLKDEVEAKRQQLQNTQGNLDDIKRQADAEKLAGLEQQQKLEQLTVELTDVENRAVKQKKMIEGSDEQWRKHHAEIEQQKLQLQQALVEAEKQNSQMQHKLEDNLEQLQEAESQVSATQSGEQKLKHELNQARDQAEQLQRRIQQQEEHERKLQEQLEQQQQNLFGSEQSIHCLEEKQAQLSQQLQTVQQEYSNSKVSLSDQHSNHTELAGQLHKLEQDLHNSQSQLNDKESALKEAKQELESNHAKLVEQENALLSAHKEELKQAIGNQPLQENKVPSEISKIVMPSNPAIWFDLLPYLQIQNVTKPLPVALNELMVELENGIKEANKAVLADNVPSILQSARKLVIVANKVNSDALTDVVTRLEEDCRQGLVDNISISWPTVKRSLNNTLRVIYSHLNN